MVEFHVLRCSQCQTFQVLQVTKSLKWKCKLCGEKQSVLKEYGRGTGADCRRHVQKLNTMRGQMEVTVENSRLNSASGLITSSSPVENPHVEQGKPSQWEAFMEDETKEESFGEEMDKHGRSFERDDQIDEGIRVTTDWSTFQNERRHNWTKKKMYHKRSKWNKSDDHEESPPSSQEQISSSYRMRYNGHDTHPYSGGENCRGAKWNQVKVSSANWKNPAPNGSHSNDNHRFLSTNSTAKLSSCHSPTLCVPSSSLENVESSLNTGAIQARPRSYVSNDFNDNNTNTKHRQSVMPIVGSKFSSPSSVSVTSISNKSINSSKERDKTTLPSKSSKWSSFITTTHDSDSENDDDDDDGAEHLITNGDCHDSPLPSSMTSHKHSGFSVSSSSNSKWRTFFHEDGDNNGEEEECEGEGNDKGASNFTKELIPNSNDVGFHVESVMSDSDNTFISMEERDCLPAIDVKEDRNRRETLFKLGDVDEILDFDL